MNWNELINFASGYWENAPNYEKIGHGEGDHEIFIYKEGAIHKVPNKRYKMGPNKGWETHDKAFGNTNGMVKGRIDHGQKRISLVDNSYESTPFSLKQKDHVHKLLSKQYPDYSIEHFE